jgi:anti-sigma-K factor RskA
MLLAAGVLDPAEAAELRAHLASCPTCRATLADAERYVDLLPAGQTQVAPGGHVWQAIQSRVAAARTDEGPRPGVIASIAGPRERSNKSIMERRATWFGVGIAAAVAALITFGVAQSHERERARQIAYYTVDVKSAVAGRNATGTLRWDRATGEWQLEVSGLAAAPAGRLFQLWAIAEGKKPFPMQTFTVDASGHGLVFDHVPAGENVALAAVTDEPSWRAAPTGSVRAVAKLN